MDNIKEYKIMEVSIDKKFDEMANEIDKADLLSTIGSYVQLLACICKKNKVDLQIDLYGYDKDVLTINYDYCYTEDDF